MSAGGAFGGARGYQPRPPEKGIFPLDHFGECKNIKEEYIACLRKHDQQANACRELARRYLECRMERNLMAPQDLKELGFSNEPKNATSTTNSSPPPPPPPRQKEQDGFIAGTTRFK